MLGKNKKQKLLIYHALRIVLEYFPSKSHPCARVVRRRRVSKHSGKRVVVVEFPTAVEEKGGVVRKSDLVAEFLRCIILRSSNMKNKEMRRYYHQFPIEAFHDKAEATIGRSGKGRRGVPSVTSGQIVPAVTSEWTC